MPSKFDDIDALAQAVIEAEAGETVTLVGMESGEFVRTEDPARPAQTCTAVVSTVPNIGRVSDGIQGRSTSGSNRNFSSSELWMSASAFAGLDWEPFKDDKVVTGSGATEKSFKISGVYVLDHGDVQIILSPGGSM